MSLIIGGSRPARLATALSAAAGYPSGVFAVTTQDIQCSQEEPTPAARPISLTGQIAFKVGKTDSDSLNEAIFGYAVTKERWPDLVIIETSDAGALDDEGLATMTAYAKELAGLSNSAVILLSGSPSSMLGRSPDHQGPRSLEEGVIVLRHEDEAGWLPAKNGSRS